VVGLAVTHEPRSSEMTDTKERQELLTEVLTLVDRGLNEMQHRELVSTDEVADLLLDVRLLLTAIEVEDLSAN
jgi:hypothetical protein